MDTPGASTSTHSQPPSVFLPRLPRTTHTLSPCSSKDIGPHVLRLRDLLLPFVPSVDGVGYEDSSKSKTRTKAADSAGQVDDETGRLSANGQDNESATNSALADRRLSTSSVASSTTSKRSRRSLVRPRSASTASHASHISSSSSIDTAVVMDEFEREWAENWLSSVVRRGEGWMADVEAEMDEVDSQDLTELGRLEAEHAAREKVLEDASAVIAMLAGCSAVGGITRELSFQLRLPGASAIGEDDRELVVRTHDAALSDHLSVGVQTWASSVLLGRIFAQEPERYLGAPPPSTGRRRPRILDLGAGTGVMSILPRAILDEVIAHADGEDDDEEEAEQGLVIATDYHPDVLANLKTCVDLNFPSTGAGDSPSDDAYPTHHSGIRILPLDWSTFPSMAEAVHRGAPADGGSGEDVERKARRAADSSAASDAAAIDAANIWQLSTSTSNSTAANAAALDPDLAQPFDVVLVVDCVYDLAHAAMIRRCLQWLVRPPELDDKGDVVVEGGIVVSLGGHAWP